MQCTCLSALALHLPVALPQPHLAVTTRLGRSGCTAMSLMLEPCPSS